MLYAWGAWLIFFFAREKISQYIEDPTLKGTTMTIKDSIIAGLAGAVLLYGIDLASRPFLRKKFREHGKDAQSSSN